jgi:hypothetical protein
VIHVKRFWTGSVAAIGLTVLILDAKTALYGAGEGIRLCIQSVIPSLFPFFVLSILLTGALTGVSIPILRPLGMLCGIPSGCESLLIIGFLGGYPAGAQCIAQAYRAGQLERNDANRLLGFCNNAGPAYLFGIVASRFPNARCAWLLWGIHILSALAVGILLPGRPVNHAKIPTGKPISLQNAIQSSIRIMAGVCAWVIVFRTVIAFLERWFLWLIPEPAQVLITGLLELSNGCCDLGRVAHPGLRFIIASGSLAFGGLCVLMQTVSATKGLGLGHYLPGKVLQAAISILLSGFAQRFFFPATECYEIPVYFHLLLLSLAVILPLSLKKIRKKSRNSALLPV